MSKKFKKHIEREESPFSKIRLVEKKKKETVEEDVRKKPSEIVQGYDPNASFKDILYSFERTGNPYTLPHPKKGRETGKAVNFGDILDKWEGRGKKKETVFKKSENKVSKSFEDILNEFEGVKKPPLKREKISVDPKNEEKITEEPSKTNPFFLEENEEDVRSSEAVWSIFGKNENRVKKAEGKQKKSNPVISSNAELNIKPDSFSSLLKREKIGSFEEMMQKKGEIVKGREKPTINELRAMLPEASLDLHGLTSDEAVSKIKEFLKEAEKGKLRKLSIIHGKGLHSKDGVGILKSTVDLLLRESGIVRETYSPKAQFGGSGVLWVILKDF